MTTDTLIDFANRGLLMVLWVSLPTVATAAGIGLLFALLQATTQLQDQTTGQVVKLVGAAIVLVLTSGWLGLSVLNFADELLRTGAFPAPSPIL